MMPCQFMVKAFSDRSPHLQGEGGALNANYRQVDALARLSNQLGELGLKYGEDWIWIGYGVQAIQEGPDRWLHDYSIIVKFYDERKEKYAKMMLKGK